MRSETPRSRSSKPPLAQLTDLFHIVTGQLEELIDAWSELSGILAERAEIVGAGANDRLCTGLRDDENPEYLAVDVARTLESHLQRLRSASAASTTSKRGPMMSTTRPPSHPIAGTTIDCSSP
jgi:hypothetical protein